MRYGRNMAHSAKPASFGHVQLGAGSSVFIVPLTPATREEAFTTASFAAHTDADLVEWRVDYFEEAPDPRACSHMAALLTGRVDKPLIATFRTPAEGGERDISDEEYQRLLISLATTGSIAGIDIELERGRGTDLITHAHRVGVSVIVSKHETTRTPKPAAIVDALAEMESMGADVAKFATTATSARDVALLAQATAEAASLLQIPLITMAMGEIGVASRLVGGIFGSAATFASIGDVSAPGQVPLAKAAGIVRQIEAWSGLTQ